MTLEQLRIFIAVAEFQHVTRAAQTLNLTQSAVSSAIQALEVRHNTKLFDRVGRGIELTRAGALFLTVAREIVMHARNAEKFLDQFGDLTRGELTIHASQTIANYWLVPHLLRFKQRYPGIETQLKITNTALVTDAVAAGQADLGFTEGAIDNEELLEEVIAQDRMILVLASGGHWASQPLRSSDDLASLSWILRERGSGTRSVFENTLTEIGIDPSRLHIAFEFSSNEAVRTAVEAGVGVTMISELVVASHIKTGTLVSSDVLQAARPFKLISHRRRHSPPVVKAFVKMLKE
jgi:DNA-binding transcriptional LysR family regulator